MTFILGLIGDPTPARYVYEPPPDRRAEVRGRQVLEKYNCAGCHLVRSGVFEFKETPQTIQQLDKSYETAASTFATDHSFLDHNAWVGMPSPRPGAITAFGDRPQLMADPDDDTGKRCGRGNLPAARGASPQSRDRSKRNPAMGPL